MAALKTNAKRLRSPAALKALEIARAHGAVPGERQKAWVIDQIVRALCGSEKAYRKFITVHNAGEDGPNTYEWDTGIAP